MRHTDCRPSSGPHHLPLRPLQQPLIKLPLPTSPFLITSVTRLLLLQKRWEFPTVSKMKCKFLSSAFKGLHNLAPDCLLRIITYHSAAPHIHTHWPICCSLHLVFYRLTPSPQAFLPHPLPTLRDPSSFQSSAHI